VVERQEADVAGVNVLAPKDSDNHHANYVNTLSWRSLRQEVIGFGLRFLSRCDEGWMTINLILVGCVGKV
jgi:hypothetical protein